ncbi:MAG: Peptidase propeptide and domain [Solirubrobacterales bacterium]|jgi:uncharacterized membrane protein YkoI|nr:Peptidase propeptide and domain [Solirubrobacterales bacterium]
MSKRIYTAVAVLAVTAVGTVGIATASNGTPAGSQAPEQETIHAPDNSGSRLDDGANLLPQAQITEAQAIRAAQTAASGPLNEVDLEDYQGGLVFNVDVGSHDVKVDASNGDVLAAPVDE